MVIAYVNKDIDVTDGKGNKITSVNRLDKLFKEDFKFEACTAISTIVDAYLYFVVNVGCELKGIKLKGYKRDKKTGLLKLTAGNTLSEIKKHKFIEKEKIIKNIEIFVSDRNYIVHNLIKTLNIAKFEEFYVVCKEIIGNLEIHLQKATIKLAKSRNDVEFL